MDHKIFLESDSAAMALVVGTFVAGALLEWLTTLRERAQTEGRGTTSLALRTLVETMTTYTGAATEADRGTKRILVGGMLAGLVAGWLAAHYVPAAELFGSGWLWVGLGLLVAWSGFALRIVAIAVLGRFFRRDVSVEPGQTIVRRGPYRLIRHPAYAGNLLIALGLGLALANWLSIMVLIVQPLAGHLPRIRVEEAALEEALGGPYRAYEAVTNRLVPGLW